jgi:hypothetical protein
MINLLTGEPILPARTANHYLARYWSAVRAGKIGSPVMRFIKLRGGHTVLSHGPDKIEICVCLLVQYLLQSCPRGGRGIVEDMATRDDEPRPVWTSLPITHQ